jgi:acyl-CoA thioester hydrolase
MQEAAFDASDAAGYSPARYAKMNRQWLVRETNIEYLHPLRYGDSVEVKTWVVDFQRATSRRAYEFYRRSELVAKSHTKWAYLDLNTGQPVTIPPELIDAFFPDGPPESISPREKFPAAPPPPPGLFSMQRRVRWQDIDPARHVNNAVYLAYVDDCAWQVSAAHGWPAERLAAEGFAIIVRLHRIQYRQPAFLNDKLEISTWASGVKKSSAVRHFRITRLSDGQVIANIHTVYVWVNLATGRPFKIPKHFLADFAPNIVG